MMTEPHSPDLQGQLVPANPLNLRTRSTLPGNRPIASNRDESMDDFIGYMD